MNDEFDKFQVCDLIEIANHAKSAYDTSKYGIFFFKETKTAWQINSSIDNINNEEMSYVQSAD